jgi:hypothetical protein
MRWSAFAVVVALTTQCSLVTSLDELGGGGSDADIDGAADVQSEADAGCGVLSSDAKNCGYCGHDCRGGQCNAGVCDPIVIASGLETPSGIAVDSTNVYFTRYLAGDVVSCPLAGCTGAPKVLSSGNDQPNDIKVDATSLYWASEGSGVGLGSIKKCALPSCTSPTTMANGTVIEWVAIDTKSFYWTSTYDGTAFSCPLAGCGGTPTPIASGLTIPWHITVDATNVYMAVWNGSINAPAKNGGEIVKCPLGGCTGAPAALSKVENEPYQVAVDTDSVYWAGFNDNTIKKCAIAGCPTGATIIASGEGGPSAIAVDDKYVYWTNYASGTVRVCAKDGCDKVSATLAVGQNHPNLIALDASYIYFTDLGSEIASAKDGSVVKVPK